MTLKNEQRQAQKRKCGTVLPRKPGGHYMSLRHGLAAGFPLEIVAHAKYIQREKIARG